MTATLPNMAKLIEDVANGQDPTKVARNVIDEAVSGPDRHEVDFAEKEAMFRQLIDQSAAEVPYLNHEYVDQVLSQLRQGASAQEMLALAQKNREQLAANHNLGTNDYPTWDAIHRSLMATYTDELPPSVG
jgi:hypothetical protein